MKYQALTIENFRGINNLNVEDLKQINLLVGRNNCGKTSILEALFLLSGMSNPQLPYNIHLFRDIALESDSGFSYLFNYCRTDNKIKISGKMDMDLRTIEIEPDFSWQEDTDQTIEKLKEQYGSSSLNQIRGLILNFSTGKYKKYEVKISLKDKMIKISDYKEKAECHFINSSTYWWGMEQKINSLIVDKKKDYLINILKKIDDRIINFEMVGKNIYMDIGTEKLMPVNIMGDGIRRIMAIIATISSIPRGIILIDEIETGLHYSSLTILWTAVIEACKKFGVQLCATTHSYECITALSKAYSSIGSEEDYIRLFRIDRNIENETHKAFSISSKALQAGIEKEFEVR
jgi:AAA15 family ATPase/GTPase